VLTQESYVHEQRGHSLPLAAPIGPAHCAHCEF
jgi:hypothetical protein